MRRTVELTTHVTNVTHRKGRESLHWKDSISITIRSQSSLKWSRSANGYLAAYRQVNGHVGDIGLKAAVALCFKTNRHGFLSHGQQNLCKDSIAVVYSTFFAADEIQDTNFKPVQLTESLLRNDVSGQTTSKKHFLHPGLFFQCLWYQTHDSRLELDALCGIGNTFSLR